MVSETILRKAQMAFLLAAGVLLAGLPSRAQPAPGPDFAADFTQGDPFTTQGRVYYSHGLLRIDLPASRAHDEPRQVLRTGIH